jgi:MFS superfamily sulfate permease-like transporter
MSVQTLTLKLPDSLYRRLQERAQEAQRTIEAEILDLIATIVPAADELPSGLAEAVSSLHLLNDEALWRSARAVFAVESAARLEDLHRENQRRELTAEERAQASALVEEFERSMLVRASAIRVLKERGHDVSSLRGGK